MKADSIIAVLAMMVGVGVVLESVWLLVTRRAALAWGELSADLVIFFVGEAVRFAMRGVFLFAYVALASLVPWRLEVSVLSALACFVLVDLLLYLWHRLMHRWRFGWALHSVHHSGHTFALPLAGRLPWPLRFVDDLVPLPLVLLGFDPALIYLCLAVSFVVQVFAHAAKVGPLGPLDLVFNTPANHRVHHHLEGEGQQRNFGAALIVWDRLFGTFVRGDGARVPVGVKGYDGDSVNPLAIQLEGLAKWWRREP